MKLLIIGVTGFVAKSLRVELLLLRTICSSGAHRWRLGALPTQVIGENIDDWDIYAAVGVETCGHPKKRTN